MESWTTVYGVCIMDLYANLLVQIYDMPYKLYFIQAIHNYFLSEIILVY